jgi:CheY-like chemotaxis protein
MLRPTNSDKTILVVEDDEITREGFAVILGRAGYQVLLAANSLEAMNLLHKGASPDLILLDMMMPGADGWQFLRVRRQNPGYRALPVLLTTALGVAGQEWALSLGACGVLHKPITEDVLLEAIHIYCAECGARTLPG